MRILLTNDDGINSPGLWRAAAALREVGEVFVCAPDREQSGVGTAVSLQSPIRASSVASQVDRVTAFAVEGTDIWAVQRGFGSITPLATDLTGDVASPWLRETARRLEASLGRR